MVILTGPAFNAEDDIICRFGEEEVDGLFLDSARALCVIPPVSEESLVELELELRRGNAELTGRAQFRYSEYSAAVELYDKHVIMLDEVFYRMIIYTSWVSILINPTQT